LVSDKLGAQVRLADLNQRMAANFLVSDAANALCELLVFFI
jgi:hypothetical protein